MSIDEEGFLSQDIKDFVNQNHTKYKETFDLISEINRYSQSLKFKIKAHENVYQELVLAVLFIRALQIFQSIIILAEKGIDSATRILIRALMEVMFTLVACAKSKEVAKKYILNDKIDSLKTIRRVKQYKGDPLLPNIKKMLTHEQSLSDEIKNEKIVPISIEEMSKLAGLHSHYLTVYDVLSRTAHVKIKDIEQNLNFSENKFNWGPKDVQMEYLLLTVVGFIVIISDNINDFFKIENSEKLKSFNDRTVELMKKINS